MNRLIFNWLHFLFIFFSLAGIAYAEKETEDSAPNTRTEEYLNDYEEEEIISPKENVRRTEAFDLVHSAYQGEYEEQGVSGYAQLITNYNQRQLTAEKLIETAIQAGDLKPQAKEDQEFINAVELQLQSIANR